MGSCLSKKSASASAAGSAYSPVSLPENPKPKSEEDLTHDVKKDIFIIKHRQSSEIERQQRTSDEEKTESEKGKTVIQEANGGAVRTSSCTKEELDAILIQCGRLSRSSSTGNGARKYSGSKRSYDFDGESGSAAAALDGDEDDAAARERENRRIERRRQSQGRRRTPSREREQRSGSRERGGRRVSKSPGRRSESPIPTTNSNSNSNSSANPKPGKMVSVPATVSPVGAEANNDGPVKRIHVKRNVGGSPRTRSPARIRGSNENQNLQPMSLSRSNSRKAENSPYRRNPLAEIDTNIISQKPNADNNKGVQQQASNKNNPTPTNVTSSKNGQQHQQEEQQPTYVIPAHVAMNVISSSGPENPKNQPPVARTRSSRLSRDLDITPETLCNPNDNSNNNNNNNMPSSYTALLLEDIQNFHHKNTTTTTTAATAPPAFSLPQCLSKACSILEAVADLNSSTGSGLSTSAPAPERKKTRPETRDPILESEVVANDDLTEPSFHKYVTVKRGSGEDDDVEELESSGSNSFAGSQQHWGVSSSCWEPNSAESTDRWAASSASRSVTRQSDAGPVGSGKKGSGDKKKRVVDHQRSAIGRGRVGARSTNGVACSAGGST